MNTSKIFALSLLLVCPLALARVNCNATMEIKGLPNSADRIITSEFQLDVDNKSTEVYRSDDLTINAQLLAENEETATISYNVYAKNEAGEFVKVSEPVLVPAYGQEATLAIGSTEGDSLNLTLKAHRI